MKISYLCMDRGISLDKCNGSAAHIQNMVKALTNLGHEVQLILSSEKGGENLGAEVIRIPVPKTYQMLRSSVRKRHKNTNPTTENLDNRVVSALGHIWGNAAVEPYLEECLQQFQPDVVYERYSPFAIAGGLLAKKAGYRHVLEVNAPLAWQGSKYRNQALMEAANLAETTAYHTTDMIRAISEELIEDIASEGVSTSKIAIVPCGVDTELFTPHLEAFPLNTENNFIIGFIGSLKPWHGIDILAAAFRKLAFDPVFHLFVLGDGPRADLIKELSDEFPGRVTHLTMIPHEEVPSYIKAMTVTVAPYPQLDRFFFSPLKILESMAVGVPVIASKIGQIPELIKPDQTGLLVTPGDVDELVNAVYRLQKEPQLTESLGINAAVEAKEIHSWSRRAEDLTDEIQQRLF